MAAFSTQAYSADVKTVLDKMIAAQGGDVLKTIKSSHSVGKIKIIPQGVEGPMTIKAVFPGKFKSEVEIMGMKFIQATDGKMGWVDNPMQGGLKKMSPKETKSALRGAVGFGDLLEPSKHGLTYALKANETVDGKSYLVLERKYEDGKSSTLYIDSKTYLPAFSKSKRDTQMGEMDVKTILSDYKKVNGVMSAHKMVQYMNGQLYLEILWDKVEYNTPVKNAIFNMPEIKKAEEPATKK